MNITANEVTPDMKIEVKCPAPGCHQRFIVNPLAILEPLKVGYSLDPNMEQLNAIFLHHAKRHGHREYRCFICTQKLLDSVASDDDLLRVSIQIENCYYDSLAELVCHLQRHIKVLKDQVAGVFNCTCCKFCSENESEVLEHIRRKHISVKNDITRWQIYICSDRQ